MFCQFGERNVAMDEEYSNRLYCAKQCNKVKLQFYNLYNAILSKFLSLQMRQSYAEQCGMIVKRI